MLRTTLRIIGFALLTSVVFGTASALLGYAAIYALNLYAPYPKSSEWVTHTVALGYLIPGIFLLSAIALFMAWGSTKSTPSRSLFALAFASGLAVALLEIIEDIPRSFAPWLAFLLPVAVVLLIFAPLKIMAARRSDSSAMSNQRVWTPPSSDK
jgi:hypothetical protein